MNPGLCLKPIPWATRFRCQAEAGHEGQCSHHHREAAKPEYVRNLENVIRKIGGEPIYAADAAVGISTDEINAIRMAKGGRNLLE